MPEIEKQIMETLGKGFTAMQETLAKSLDEKMGAVKGQLTSVTEQLAAMKAASARASSVGISAEVRTAFGNGIKKTFNATVAEGAPVLTTKADEVISGGTTGGGAELLFTELHTGILTLAQTYGSLFAAVHKYPTTQRTYRIVFGTMEADDGDYDTEASDRELDKTGFSAKELTALKWRKIIGITKEAIEDSAPEDLASYVMELLAKHYGRFMDKKIVAAIVADSAIPTKVLGGLNEAALTYDSLIDLTTLADSDTASNAFRMHKKVWASVRKLKDTTGKPLVEINRTPQLQSNGQIIPGQAVGFIDGYPVYLTRAMESTYGANKVMVIFGDLDQGVGAIIRKDFAVESDSSQKFSSDIVLAKGTSRNRVTTLVSESLAVLKCSAS